MVELLRPFVQISDLSNDALTQLLLYGDQDLSYDLNKNILKLTLRFIRETGRFDFCCEANHHIKKHPNWGILTLLRKKLTGHVKAVERMQLAT